MATAVSALVYITVWMVRGCHLSVPLAVDVDGRRGHHSRMFNLSGMGNALKHPVVVSVRGSRKEVGGRRNIDREREREKERQREKKSVRRMSFYRRWRYRLKCFFFLNQPPPSLPSSKSLCPLTLQLQVG